MAGFSRRSSAARSRGRLGVPAPNRATPPPPRAPPRRCGAALGTPKRRSPPRWGATPPPRPGVKAASGDRACQLVTVLGTDGVGKSRLLAEFIKGVNGRATILRGRCLSYGQGITLWPVAEVVRTAAHLQDFDEPATAELRIADLL